jgi:hypothetical protein
VNLEKIKNGCRFVSGNDSSNVSESLLPEEQPVVGASDFIHKH